MERRSIPATLLGILLMPAGTPLASTLHAADLVQEALNDFPSQVVRVEYARPAKLRTIAGYEALRGRFLGPRLKAVEDTLAGVGIQEKDVDEFVLGWEPEGGGLEMAGLALGRFSLSGIETKAPAAGARETEIRGHRVYCFGQGKDSSCALALDSSLGMFGSPAAVRKLLDTREGDPSAKLSSNDALVKLMREVSSDAPIWGVAVGSGVPDWFKGWMPNQADLQLSWGKMFSGVRDLVYSVRADGDLRLEVKMECASQQEAANLRQTLEGVKLFQQITWQSQHPNRANPFETMTLDVEGQLVIIKVSASATEIVLAGLQVSPIA